MNNKRGFTLVELLVTIVILGIVTTLSIPLIHNIQEHNKDKEYDAYRDTLKYSAKLYIDSYGDDIFGRHRSGCSLIKYSDMVDKGLLKDIPIENVSCNSSDTYVKVVKIDNKYGYATSIGCGRVDSNHNVIVDIKLPKETVATSETCQIGAKTIMDFSANPDKKDVINYKRQNMKFTISSNTGISDDMKIYYGFSYNKDTNVINNNWQKLDIKVPGKSQQKKDILDGNTIEITSNELKTPEGVTGKLYLVIQIEKLENLSSDTWSSDKAVENVLYYGPYTVDNIKPKFNNSTIISSEKDYNSNTPKLQLAATDEKFSLPKDFSMCISYDSDTCSMKVGDIKKKTTVNNYINNTKYEAYSSNKVLSVIKNTYDASTHTIHVVVSDAAGNYEKKSFQYRIAQRWTLTYDSNGGNACNPTTKAVTFNAWNKTMTWGTLCTPTRTNYTFTGWNTKKDGTGSNVTKDTVANSNLRVYAQWRKNRVIFQVRVLDGGSLTSQTRADNGTIYRWTKDGNSYLYLNGNRYTTAINFDAKTLDLANYNNAKYLNITKTGYRGDPGKEWICIDGCKTKNQTFNHNQISITPSTICDYSKANCTVTLKVKWVVISYSITYTLGGGTATNKTSYNIETPTFTLTNPTRNGYKFTGWTGSNGNTKQTTVQINKGSTGNKAYTANWESLFTFSFKYTGNFSYQDGNASWVNKKNTSVELKSQNWQVKFLTSGTLTINGSLSNIDAFLVGGGGGAGKSGWENLEVRGGGGGGGGYTTTKTNISVSKTNYAITIGSGGGFNSGGGTTTAFGYSANGGSGSGFSWLSDGRKEAGGGGVGGSGGGGGSGRGGWCVCGCPGKAAANKGGGGAMAGGSSGIVIIRNTR